MTPGLGGRETPRPSREGLCRHWSLIRGHWSLPCFRLRPFTSYKLRLKATNDIGDSDFSVETEPVTTLQDGEPRGPAGRGVPHVPLLPLYRNSGPWREAPTPPLS